MKSQIIDESFPHAWRARILSAPPLIRPARSYIYPREVEEVKKGALEIMIFPNDFDTQHFLATCALGFCGNAVPTGVWSCPNPEELCAISGGYAYIIPTRAPERFTMIPYRPVLTVHPVPDMGLLLFVNHRSIFAWNCNDQAWESEKLSDEGLQLTGIQDGYLHGTGWSLFTDKETLFTIDLRTGRRI